MLIEDVSNGSPVVGHGQAWTDVITSGQYQHLNTNAQAQKHRMVLAKSVTLFELAARR